MKQAKRWVAAPIEGEFAGAGLGDERRSRRLELIAGAVASRPDAGFPQAFASDSGLEAFYRFVGNDAVQMDDVLEPHVQSTLARAALLDEVIVVHDTTVFTFGGAVRREGLGHTVRNAQGFLGHFALAVAPDESRTPLGVLGVETIVRKPHKKNSQGQRPKTHKDYEFRRWFNMLDRVETLREDFEAVHVMDREADFYDLLEHANDEEARFVIRAARNRYATEDDEEWVRLEELTEHLEPQCFRTVSLSARGAGLNPTMRKTHPPRKGRNAELCIAGLRVGIRPPRSNDKGFELNVVRVWEPKPPRGEEPVHWLLMTTEPIDSDEALSKVVEIYRTRWVIEEYFKALKTGCSFEKRQLESLQALTVALAIFVPVAWRMLLIRSVARVAPTTPARHVLNPLLLTVLAHKIDRGPTRLTVEEALYAIARLGGHLKRNGPPGWQTLGRGFQELLQLAEGWQVAMKAMGRDVINPQPAS